jgi:hypothetical protein
LVTYRGKIARAIFGRSWRQIIEALEPFGHGHEIPRHAAQHVANRALIGDPGEQQTILRLLAEVMGFTVHDQLLVASSP